MALEGIANIILERGQLYIPNVKTNFPILKPQRRRNHRIKMNTEGSMQQIYREVKLCTRIIDFKMILHDLLTYINHFGRIHKVSNNQF